VENVDRRNSDGGLFNSLEICAGILFGQPSPPRMAGGFLVIILIVGYYSPKSCYFGAVVYQILCNSRRLHFKNIARKRHPKKCRPGRSYPEKAIQSLLERQETPGTFREVLECGRENDRITAIYRSELQFLWESPRGLVA